MPPTGDASTSPRKPRDRDIDVHGLTHRGKVRKENQDHFLIGSLSKRLLVDLTSLPADSPFSVEPERLASIAMIADGVGGGGGGEEASREALQGVAQYVAESTNAFYGSGAAEPAAFAEVLAEAAMRCHARLVDRAGQQTGRTR